MLLFAVMIISIVVFGIYVPESIGFADVDVPLFATAVIGAVVSVVVFLQTPLLLPILLCCYLLL